MAKTREKAPVATYSPWYNDQFVSEKLEAKQEALAKREEMNEIRSAKDWNEKAQRRFQRLWDRLGDETKRSYQSSARHFGKYLGLRRVESQVSKIVARLILLSYTEATTLVDDYIMWMEEDLDLAPNTINVRLAALRWFVDGARRVGWVSWKLDTKGVKGGKVRDTSGPSNAEFRRILRVVNTGEGPGAVRDRLIVYMLSFMALRISSVISLDMENIDFEKRCIKVKWKGKGDKLARYVWRPVGPETFEALEDWLELRGRGAGPIIKSLDRGKQGSGRLSIRSAQRIIENIGREAATKKKLTPHAFRHFHATDSLQHDDTRRVMKSTGHTNIKTIEHYDDSGNEAAREVATAMEQRWLGDLDETEEEDEQEIEERYQDPEEEESDIDDDDLAELGVSTSEEAIEEAEDEERLDTGMAGFNKLLGGEDDNVGLVHGSIVLLGGFPGIGKSTLARQVCYNIVKTNPGTRVLIASGEEKKSQLGKALDRLGCSHKRLLLMAEKSINRITYAAEKLEVDVLVIDSVSTVVVDECDKPPGSITQVKAIGEYMMAWCKGVGKDDDEDGESGSGIAVIIISHVDKKGNIAGPKTLEHHVDAVYSFMSPSKRSKMRSLGCEGKNRFGDATGEIYFKMTNKGLVEQSKKDILGYEEEDDEYDEDPDEFDFGED